MVQTKSSESANRGQQIAPVLSGHSSPRPWNNSTADETQICDRNGYDIATTFLGAADYDENYMTRAADAALIVRAVNSHDALTKALTNLVGQIEQAKDGFGIYSTSPSMALAISSARTALTGAK